MSALSDRPPRSRARPALPTSFLADSSPSPPRPSTAAASSPDRLADAPAAPAGTSGKDALGVALDGSFVETTSEAAARAVAQFYALEDGSTAVGAGQRGAGQYGVQTRIDSRGRTVYRVRCVALSRSHSRSRTCRLTSSLARPQAHRRLAHQLSHRRRLDLFLPSRRAPPLRAPVAPPTAAAAAAAARAADHRPAPLVPPAHVALDSAPPRPSHRHRPARECARARPRRAAPLSRRDLAAPAQSPLVARSPRRRTRWPARARARARRRRAPGARGADAACAHPVGGGGSWFARGRGRRARAHPRLEGRRPCGAWAARVVGGAGEIRGGRERRHEAQGQEPVGGRGRGCGRGCGRRSGEGWAAGHVPARDEEGEQRQSRGEAERERGERGGDGQERLARGP